MTASGFDDYRPEVHDSDGLYMKRGDGEEIWRPLNNPPALANSYFDDDEPAARSGCCSAQRNFDAYQDAGGALRAPAVGAGRAASATGARARSGWSSCRARRNTTTTSSRSGVPAQPAKAGDTREFAYRLSWGDLRRIRMPTWRSSPTCAMGHGGNAIDAPDPNVRKFVVDFRGGELAEPADDAKISAVTTVTGGTILQTAVFKVDADGDWRLIIDVQMGDGKARRTQRAPCRLRAATFGNLALSVEGCVMSDDAKLPRASACWPIFLAVPGCPMRRSPCPSRCSKRSRAGFRDLCAASSGRDLARSRPSH